MIMDAKKLQKCVPPALPNAFSGGRKKPLTEAGIWHAQVKKMLQASAGESEALASIASDPQAMQCVRECLMNGEMQVRAKTAWALFKAAEAGIDTGLAFPELAECLGNRDPELRKNSGFALMAAAVFGRRKAAMDTLSRAMLSHDQLAQGAAAAALKEAVNEYRLDISPLFQALINCFGGIASAQRNSVAAFESAMENGQDISVAIPGMIGLILAGNRHVRGDAAGALENFISRAGPEALSHIIGEMAQFVNSEEFWRAADSNSVKYAFALNKLNWLAEYAGRRLGVAA
jgi:hypothetical protein